MHFVLNIINNPLSNFIICNRKEIKIKRFLIYHILNHIAQWQSIICSTSRLWWFKQDKHCSQYRLRLKLKKFTQMHMSKPHLNNYCHSLREQLFSVFVRQERQRVSLRGKSSNNVILESLCLNILRHVGTLMYNLI